MAPYDVDDPRTRAAAEREAWFRGDLEHLLLDGAQSVAYAEVHGWEENHPGDPGPCVLHMHRGSAKSWLLVILAMERCLRYPNQVARIGSPYATQTEEIVEPAIRFLLGLCPPELRPVSHGDELHFRNPRWEDPQAISKLVTFGCREHAERQRGLRSTFIALDEVRDIDDPEYVVTSVLAPHFVRQEMPIFILSSTSPGTTGHPFWSFVDDAAKDRRYVYIPVTANPGFTAQDERVLMKFCKSKESVAWKREALCLKVADPNLLAVPSFFEHKPAIVREWTRPDYFLPFLFGDVGYIDAAAFLFAFIDFIAQKLVIEDEIVLTTTGTKSLADTIKAKESALYGETANYKLMRRWADATPRELDDFRGYGVLLSAARTGSEKWDKWAGLARLESLCQEEKLVIHPRCRSTIFQLENAVKNRQHTDIQRELPKEGQDPTAPVMAHFDAGWALAYGIWQVRNSWLQNPVPAAPLPQRAWAPPPQVPFGRVKVTHNPIVITGNVA